MAAKRCELVKDNKIIVRQWEAGPVPRHWYITFDPADPSATYDGDEYWVDKYYYVGTQDDVAHYKFGERTVI